VSPYRNSKVCPIHFALLRDNGGWHTLYCPHGHAVDRDAAAVLNMLWKATPEGAVKGVWWDVKEVGKRLKKEVVPKEAVRRANPIIPRPAAYAIWTSLKALQAGDKWPAMLARAASTTPPKAPMKAGRGRLPAGREPPPIRTGRRSVKYAGPII